MNKGKESQKNFLQSASRYVSIFYIFIIPFIFLRGHNRPGGGFIGALLMLVFIKYMLWQGISAKNINKWLSRSICLGLLCITSVLVWGYPYSFLQAFWWQHVGTPMLFDLGVFFLVTGSLGLLYRKG